MFIRETASGKLVAALFCLEMLRCYRHFRTGAHYYAGKGCMFVLLDFKHKELTLQFMLLNSSNEKLQENNCIRIVDCENSWCLDCEKQVCILAAWLRRSSSKTDQGKFMQNIEERKTACVSCITQFLFYK